MFCHTGSCARFVCCGRFCCSGGIAGFYLGSVFVLGGLATIIGALGYFNSFVLLAVLAVVAMVFMLIAVATSPMKKEKKAEE